MKKIICPFCFKKFRKSKIWFRCENKTCKGPDKNNPYPKNDEKIDKYWGNMGPKLYPFLPSFSIFGSETAKCPVCKETTHKVICPECHNSLDKEMLQDDTSIISIIGGKSSGKTNYITVLIWELIKRGYTFDAIHEVVTCGDYVVGKNSYTTAYRYTNDFYNQLYEKRKVHAPTEITETSKAYKVPLIYRLTIGESSRGKGKGKSVFLVFYDTAGESFTSNERIHEYAEFLRNSAGIIFLLDTWGISALKPKIEKITNEKPLPFDYIFENIKEYMRQKMTAKDREKFKSKPFAFAFSKIDTILTDKDFDINGLKMDMNSSFLTDKKLSLSDLYGMHMGLNNFLIDCDESNFLKSLGTHFGEKVTFFGFSALGQMPENGEVKQNIEPYRALDPLVWILYELGYPIPLKKEKPPKKEIVY